MIAAPATDLLTVRDAAERRRSIRHYTDAPVPRADLDEILRVTSLAPSAFNAQPWRFVVVESAEVKARVAAAAGNQRQFLSAPAVIVLYTDMADTLATVVDVMHPGMEEAKRRSAAAGFAGNFASKSEVEREGWGAEQGNIALGYLLLAAESLGYQTSPMLGFNAGAVKDVLGLPAHVRIPALVAIGKGAEDGFAHHRHPANRIVRFV